MELLMLGPITTCLLMHLTLPGNALNIGRETDELVPHLPCVIKNDTADCTGRHLSTVPPSIPSNITTLLFHHNILKRLNQSQFARFEVLITLDLSDNRISHVDGSAFEGLRKLQHLYLDNNQLPYNRSTYNDSLFQPLKDLIVLRINGSRSVNSTEYPDNALQYLNSLETLYIDGLHNTSFGNGFAKLKNLKTLALDGSKGHCNMVNIHTQTFLQLIALENVFIKHCKLSYIEPRSFAHLENLTVLDLSHNVCLSIDGVTNATEKLSSTRLEKLYANQIERKFSLCVTVTDRFAYNLQNTSLEEIQLNENEIIAFGNKALEFFPNSTARVSIQDNRLHFAPYVLKIPLLTGLKKVDLSGKYSITIHNIPEIYSPETLDGIFQYCPNKKNSHFDYWPSFSNKYLFSLFQRKSYKKFTYNVPQNLEILKYSKAQIYLHLTELHVGNNSIKTIDISDNLITRWQGPVFGLDHLTHLDLSTNRAGYLDQTFFDTFSNLVFLNISFNYLGKSIRNDTNGRIFKKLIKLKILDLSENEVQKCHLQLFSGLVSLQKLYITHNNIHNFPVDVHRMTTLLFIDLKFNQLRWLKGSFRNQLDALATSHTVQMDISENTLACNCDNLHFLNWLLTSHVQFDNISNYRCIYSNGEVQYFTHLDSLYLDLETSCYYFSFAIGMTVVVLLSLIIMFGGIIFRCRWKLRYLYYAAKNKYNQNKDAPANEAFAFDAFVSFADGDRGFVVNELVNSLEEEGGLSLNIHQRDFTPGRPIAENIIEAIQKSRRTLCVLSRDFLESYWCKYELQMANMESVTTGRDVLLIVMMDHIPTEKIPAEILYHIQTDSYIQYPAEGETDMFWRNLIHSLKT